MKKNKYNIGDTVILKRRWFLWFREPVLCEVLGGRWVTDEAEVDVPEWRYVLKIGNALVRFLMWESEIDKQRLDEPLN